MTEITDTLALRLVGRLFKSLKHAYAYLSLWITALFIKRNVQRNRAQSEGLTRDHAAHRPISHLFSRAIDSYLQDYPLLRRPIHALTNRPMI